MEKGGVNKPEQKERARLVIVVWVISFEIYFCSLVGNKSFFLFPGSIYQFQANIRGWLRENAVFNS